MIINGTALLSAAPIDEMFMHKVQGDPTSYGLTECGYDIRIAEDIIFTRRKVSTHNGIEMKMVGLVNGEMKGRRAVLGSSIECFGMPTNLMGRVLNKSTWARKFLDCSLTTNIEPGWRGHLTIEMVYSGEDDLFIPKGAGICQVIFETLAEDAQYKGKYQDQKAEPVEAMMASDLLRSDKMSENTKAMMCQHGLTMWDHQEDCKVCAKCGEPVP